MCTNECAQPEHHFQRLGDLLRNHPERNPNSDELSSEKVHCRKVSATFSHSLKCTNFQGKCKNTIFSQTIFAEMGKLTWDQD